MSRWIRFIFVALMAVLRRKVVPHSSLRLRFWTWVTDADLSLINNAAILTYTEFGRIDMLFRSRLIFHLLKRGIYFPAAAIHVTFHRPLRRFQRLELETGVCYWDAHWMWMEHKLYLLHKGEKKLAAHSYVRVTFRKAKTNIPFSDLMKEIGIELPSLEKPEIISAIEKLN